MRWFSADQFSGAPLESASFYGSGNIVEMAGPYAPFPPDIRRDTDIIEITRTWSFTGSDQLQTN